MTGGDLLIECLLQQGVTDVFGMPGLQIDHIYGSLIRRQDRIRHVLYRNEQSGALMAEGYARASGRPGVCLTVPGPGATNAATAVAEASSASTPLLLITGGSKREFQDKHPTRLFHGLDHDRFFAPVTKWHGIVLSPADIPQFVEQAFEHLLSGRPGPVHLEFPPDVLEETVEAVPCAEVKRVPQPTDTSDLEALTAELSKARAPIIIAGMGVVFSHGAEALRRLSETWQAPVTTSLLARGAVSEEHPLSLGCMRGAKAGELIEAADCVLAVGCRFTQLDSRTWTLGLPQPLFCLATDEHDVPPEYPVAAAIHGEISTLLESLTDDLQSHENPPRDDWLKRVEIARNDHWSQKTYPLISALREVAPKDAIIGADVHTNAYRMQAFLPVFSSRSYLYSAVYVGLGYGLPAAIGAKIHFPEKCVLAVCGDGGFGMTGTEIGTVAQEGMDLKIIVINDGGFTSIRPGQERITGGQTLGADLKNPDYMKLAEAYEIQGLSVSTADRLQATLEEAMNQTGPVLVELENSSGWATSS